LEDIKLGSLILAALFGLPGFVFVLIITKYSFKTSRISSGTTIQLLFSIIVSTFLVGIFDWQIFRDFLVKLLFGNATVGPLQEAEYFLRNTKFSGYMLEALFNNKAPQDIRNILTYYFVYIGTFSVILALLVSAFLNFLLWCSKASYSRVIIGIFYSAEFIGRKLGKAIGSTLQFLRKKYAAIEKKYCEKFPLFNFIVKVIKNVFSFLNGLLFVLVVILFVLFVILLLATLFSLNVFSELILWLYHKALSLFQHPWEQAFEPIEFNLRSGIPMVEIFTEAEKINKGVFKSFFPKNSEEISSVTISRVIQYTKEEKFDFFDRETRRVYEFPNKNSLLTISAEQIKDINVTYLRYVDFGWSFKITSPSSVVNQIWYLRLILENHKGEFEFNKFNAWIDPKYAPVFFLEILRLIDQNYSTFPYGYKRKRLVIELVKIWSNYKKALKKDILLLTDDEKSELAKSKSAFASYLNVMRIKNHKFRK